MAESESLTPPPAGTESEPSVAGSSCSPAPSTSDKEQASDGSNSSLDKSPTSVADTMPVAVLQKLAKQLEYYFSDINLSSDTYLNTLRGLNDGYVPITILSTFSKVQSLAYPFDAVEAVTQAATEHSELLDVVYLDKETSKKVETTGDSKDKDLLCCVGTQDSKPIPLASPNTARNLTVSAAAAPLPPALPSPGAVAQNTVILRDVPSEANKEDIQTLFDGMESCPTIESIHKDVANTWFVTMNVKSRDELLPVMLNLRSKSLKGEPVKARLKAISAAPAEAAIDANTIIPPPVYSGDRNMTFTISNNNATGNQRKSGGKQQSNNHGGSSSGSNKKKRGNNINNKHGGKHNNSTNSHGEKTKSPSRRSNSNNSGSVGSGGTSGKVQPKPAAPRLPPPSLVEESHFPSLMSEPKKQELVVEKNVVVVDEGKSLEDSCQKTPSDAASTATTSTASSLVGSENIIPPAAVKKTGYAAALLKPPSSPTTPVTANKATTGMINSSEAKIEKKSAETVGKDMDGEEEEEAKPTVVTWGRGPSFADILKKESTAAAGGESPSS